jgi:hypothetical protein
MRREVTRFLARRLDNCGRATWQSGHTARPDLDFGGANPRKSMAMRLHRERSVPKRERPPPPTVKLSPIESSALLYEPGEAAEHDRETVEIVPLVQPEPVEEPPRRLAQGTSPRRRLARTNLRLKELEKPVIQPEGAVADRGDAGRVRTHAGTGGTAAPDPEHTTGTAPTTPAAGCAIPGSAADDRRRCGDRTDRE